MTTQQIQVKATPRDITVQPTRLGLPTGSGPVDLKWIPVGTSVEIDEIAFDKTDAPISNLRKVGDNWEGTWSTAQRSTWKYSVTVTVNGERKPVLDPEIENGPPDSDEGDEDEDEDGDC